MRLDTRSQTDTIWRALRLGSALVATLVTASCALFTEPESPRVSVELPAAVFAPGDVVELTMLNASDRPWYYTGLCNNDLQRRDGDAWVQVYENVYGGCGLAIVAVVLWLSS